MNDYNRVCFPDSKAPLRNHEDFITYTDKDFHRGTSLITNIPGFNIISSTPYDYLHLICIGVTKKLISFWVCSNHSLALPSSLINALHIKLNNLEKYIPVEFQRKPNENSRKHPLRDINRWKGTELRQSLLHTGIIIFKNILSSDVYQYFLVLFVAIRILASKSSDSNFITHANQLLHFFVEKFIDLYGISHMPHMVKPM